MDERRIAPRRRALRQAKIVFNGDRSVIDCLVRNLSDSGACLEVASQAGVPTVFALQIEGETPNRQCLSIWQSDNKIGVEFANEARTVEDEDAAEHHPSHGRSQPAGLRVAGAQGRDLIRSELLTLRAALDEAEFGVVLLDAAMRAQFINRAFRKMVRLPDAKADARPAFASLMHHGAETGAYEISPQDMAAYVAERIEAVVSGDARPRDLRLRNGEVLRFQCAILPAGGRMLSYTYVTDIIRQSDTLAMLGAAFDTVESGVILLDGELNAQLMNRAVRRLWGISDELAKRRPPYAELVSDTRRTGALANAGPELEALIALRIAHVRAGISDPMDLRRSDGRVIRSRCVPLPNGGRMLTYGDVTDLVHHADELEALARIDALTGIANRRHFLEFAEIEWSRLERYERPLSLLMIDIDNFKAINDRFGHDAGDKALTLVARICANTRRHADIAGRIGGEEFAVLLPETPLLQAQMVAERLRLAISKDEIVLDGGCIKLTISVGVAETAPDVADFAHLMKRADRALYAAKTAGRNRVALAQSDVAAE